MSATARGPAAGARGPRPAEGGPAAHDRAADAAQGRLGGGACRVWARARCAVDRRFWACATAALLALVVAGLAACSGAALRMPGPGRMPWAPEALLDIESRAEAAADAALAGDAAQASSSARAAVRLWPEVRRAVAERAVDPALLRRADSVVSDLEGAASGPSEPGGASAAAGGVAGASGGPSPDRARLLQLAEKANAVAGYAAGFMNLFQMTVPAAIPTLDFQARAAQIEARLGEWKAAEAYVGALDGTMLAFFPTARAKAPEDLPELERRLAALGEDAQKRDAAVFERDARRFIQAVERLRASYVRGK